MSDDRLHKGESGIWRCKWSSGDAQYERYHDDEWGRPVTDDQRLYEKLCLEGFQSGLAWITILRKRDNFRDAFQQFDLQSVARFTSDDVERLMDNAGIVRHRGKIEASINNAQRAIELIEDKGSLATYLWGYAVDAPFGHNSERLHPDRFVAQSKESEALSKDLKKRGWKFVGPTTVYSFMQSMGLVNDHFEGCEVRDECEQLRNSTLRSLRI